MGKAIIITRGLATQDYVIDRENAILVDPCDAHQLKNEMLWLLTHSSEYKKLGKNARKSVEEKFTMTKSTEKLANLLHNIVMKN